MSFTLFILKAILVDQKHNQFSCIITKFPTMSVQQQREKRSETYRFCCDRFQVSVWHTSMRIHTHMISVWHKACMRIHTHMISVWHKACTRIHTHMMFCFRLYNVSFQVFTTVGGILNSDTMWKWIVTLQQKILFPLSGLTWCSSKTLVSTSKTTQRHN
jgi:hypothetical protein